MPFDGQPDRFVADLDKLRRARDGIAGEDGWMQFNLNLALGPHCVLGWLYAATEQDVVEATRLAVEYVYPVLPKRAQGKCKVASIFNYNDHDNTSQRSVVRLLNRAIDHAYTVKR